MSLEKSLVDSAFGDSRFGTTQPSLLGFARAGGSRRQSVPRHIGLIEPWIGFALAASTAWLFALAFRDRPILGAYVAGALALALWAWRRPARQQSALMARGMLFALMGLIMTWVQGGGVTNNSTGFFWISVPVIFYGLLLRTSYAWALLGLNVVIAFSVVMFSEGDIPLGGTLARVGLLLIFTGASIRMGAVLRRTDELLEARRVDASSGMLNEYGFVDYGADPWADCRRGGQPVTLVFLDMPDLGGLRSLYGARIARLAVDKALHLMESLATGRNLVGRLGPSRFALLMPGATHEQAMQFLGDRLGHPPRIEIDENDVDLMFLVNIHAAESLTQNVSFSRFFESERDLLDFYFNDRREGDAPADAGPAPVPQPVATPVAVLPPISNWQASELHAAPSTMPMGPG